MTYAPLAHLPRSIARQCWLQKGYSGSLASTIFLQRLRRQRRHGRYGGDLSGHAARIGLSLARHEEDDIAALGCRIARPVVTVVLIQDRRGSGARPIGRKDGGRRRGQLQGERL